MMRNLLIIEDEEFLVQALKDSFEQEGYEVDVALDGDEGMAHIAKTRPDLILLDLLMPKKDGFYVLEQVKKNPDLKMIPIIVLSNLGGDEEIKKALSLGADDYFVKSQHAIQEILEKVKDYLEGRMSSKVSVLRSDTTTAFVQGKGPTDDELIKKIN